MKIKDVLFICAMVCFGISILFSIISCYLTSDMCKYRGYMRLIKSYKKAEKTLKGSDK